MENKVELRPESTDEIQDLKKRIALLEEIVSNIQLRLGFAGEPHKDQKYGPKSIEVLLKNARNRFKRRQ